MRPQEHLGHSTAVVQTILGGVEPLILKIFFPYIVSGFLLIYPSPYSYLFLIDRLFLRNSDGFSHAGSRKKLKMKKSKEKDWETAEFLSLMLNIHYHHHHRIITTTIIV